MAPPKRILFRVDASVKMGTGHVVRCLTLATSLRRAGSQVEFACRLLEGNLCDLIEERGFVVHRLPAQVHRIEQEPDAPKHAAWLGASWDEDACQTKALVENGAGFDWIIVDHYALDHRWETSLRFTRSKLMVIDDLADRVHRCDLLLDQNLVADIDTRYQGLAAPGCQLLLGPKYALLQDEYSRLRSRVSPRQGPISRVLVSFGGYDSKGLTEMTVQALIALSGTPVVTDVVLSSASPQFARIAKLSADTPGLRLHDRVPCLASLMLSADFAIGSSGTTNWERLSLGIPALIVTVAENQRPIAEELARRDLVRWLGDAADVEETILSRAIAEILSAGLDRAWSERCLATVDGRGSDRVAALILAGAGMDLTIRHAVVDDEELLLEWRNNPQTRYNAFNSREITPAAHRTWFRSRLRRPEDFVLLIVETTRDVPVGQVRFDRHGSFYEISYAVAPVFRRRGVGKALLAAAIEAFRVHQPGVLLVGRVKIDNFASIRIFEQLGFAVRDGKPDCLFFEQRI